MPLDSAERTRQLTPTRQLEGFWPAANLARHPPRPRTFIMPDATPADVVTNLSGDGGTGESQVALQLAAAVALGKPWLGREVARGPAMYLAAEDDADEIHRRLLPIAAALECGIDDLVDLHIRSVSHGDAALVHLGPGRVDPTSVGKDLYSAAAEIKPRLIVLDTAADLFPGNEIDRNQVKTFIRFLRRSASVNCATVLLTHPSVAGKQTGSGTSGSTAWTNVVRSHLYLTRVEGDPDARRIENRKMNYGRVGAFNLSLRWRDGIFVADGRRSDAGPPSGDLSKAKAAFLRLLEWHTAGGRTVSGQPDGSGGGKNFAPTIFANHEESDGVTRAAFLAAMRELFAAGEIVVKESGPPSRRRSHIVRAGG